MKTNQRFTKEIIKTIVDQTSIEEATTKIIQWAMNKDTKYVSITNTDVVVRSWINKNFREIINSSDLSTPDGAPISFILRLQGCKDQRRVTGPDLLEKLIVEGSKKNLKLFFYGSTKKVLDLIKKRIKNSNLDVDVYFKSPPFRRLSEIEEEEIIKAINKIQPNIIFVGLGCPKQDIWINDKKNKINSVFISIGAAFDFYAKTLERAPMFMRNNGLEWLHRLHKEPLRLYKRYISIIFLFGTGISIQLISFLVKNIFKDLQIIFTNLFKNSYKLKIFRNSKN